MDPQRSVFEGLVPAAPSRSAARVCALLGVVTMLTPGFAQAATEAPESWLGLPTPFWAWANLAVFWGLLLYFTLPLVRSFFTRRRAGIKSDLENARRQQAEAEEMRSGLEARLEELAAEMERLGQRSEEEGEKEHRQILEQARAESERILEQTKDEIDNRVAQSKAELTALTARLAAGLAKSRVEQRLSSENRRRIFERNLVRLREREAGGS